MACFAYQAMDETGNEVSGAITGKSAEAAEAFLVQQRLQVLSLQLVAAEAGAAQGLFSYFYDRRKVKEDLLLFVYHLSVVLAEHVPLLDALRSFCSVCRCYHFKSAVQGIMDQLAAGQSFASCLASHGRIFDDYFCSVVRLGERAGSLDVVFAGLARYLEARDRMQRQLWAKLRYPCWVLGALVGAFVLFLSLVLPAFEAFFASFNAPLPWVSQALVDISLWFKQWGALCIIAILLTVLTLSFYLRINREWHHKWDRLKYRMPILGPVIWKISLARFFWGIALAYEQGLSLPKAVRAVSLTLKNVWFTQRCLDLIDYLERGDSFSQALEVAQVFPDTVVQLVVVGEKTGQLKSSLKRLAAWCERDAETKLAAVDGILEPMLVLILGTGVLLVAIGIFIPMWDLGKVALSSV